LPKGAPDSTDVVFTDPWMLASDSLRPEAGWRFIKFLTEPEQARNYMLATGAPPVRLSLLDEYFSTFPSMSPEELRQALLGSISHGVESSNHLLVRFDQINNVLQSELVDPVNLEEGTAAEIVPEAAQALSDTLRQIFQEVGGQSGS